MVTTGDDNAQRQFETVLKIWFASHWPILFCGFSFSPFPYRAKLRSPHLFQRASGEFTHLPGEPSAHQFTCRNWVKWESIRQECADSSMKQLYQCRVAPQLPSPGKLGDSVQQNKRLQMLYRTLTTQSHFCPYRGSRRQGARHPPCRGTRMPWPQWHFPGFLSSPLGTAQGWVSRQPPHYISETQRV